MSPLKSLMAVAAFLAAAPAAAQIAQAVDAIGITVSDMDRAVAFYGGVLSFQVVSDSEVAGPSHERLTGVFGARIRVVRMALGDERIELIEYLAPTGRPIPVDSRSNDLWFQHIAIIVSDMDRAYAWLRRHDVQHASTAPQTLPDWNPDAGGIRAFYFKDPDGNPLEILWFPPDKGDPRWHAPTDRLFLGIDHTAIVVDDTEASLALYRDRLGMAVAGAAENWGSEQEHLNNVFGARLRITALRAADGPGIELLEYLAPDTGRPQPVDTAANDLWHEQTVVVTADAEAATAALREAGYDLISAGTIDLDPAELGFAQAALVRDPDGHALLLIER